MTDTMTVTRIYDENGHGRVEPPFDSSWPKLTRLRWHAAVVAHDAGLTIEIRPGGEWTKILGKWIPVPGAYTIRIGSAEFFPSTIAVKSYRDTWECLNGVEAGARAQSHLVRP